MTISCGLCWNIDSRKIIWPPRAHFGSENESLKGLKYGNLEKKLFKIKNLHMCQIVLSSASVDEFSREWMVFKSNYPLTFLSRQKIHVIRHCIPCQVMNWTSSDNRRFPKLAKNSGQLRVNSTFLPLVNMLKNGCQLQTGSTWTPRVVIP